MISSNLVLTVTPEDEEEIKKHFQLTEEEIEQIFNELLQWKSSQPHLPEDAETSHLQCMLRLNKFNLEKTKWKLDNYYTYKNFTPEFYENRNPLHPPIKKLLDNIMVFPLPKLLNNTTRVSVAKLLNNDPKVFDHESLFKIVFAIGDLRLHYDKAIFDVYIFDYTGFQLWHIFKIKPALIKKGFEVIRNVFSERIQGIHLIHCPTYAYAIITLTKTFLPKKISNRIHFHDNYDSISEYIDLDILPNEFGGKNGAIEDLYENWRQFLIENDEWIQKESKKKSIEELRNKESESFITKFFNAFKL